ncbi:MAG TPA: PaaI family thioesterase [Dissulfurispiraceae bacterium]|nr:PaaI family thioesterase [Dissulfurispiraceae bacterium]
MAIIDDGQCFVCGKNNKNGLQLSFTSSGGKSLSEFTLKSNFQGYKNIIHGGLITAILDEAMIYAAMSEKCNPVTAEITVRFKHPLSAGQAATVEAELTRKTDRLVEAKARITELISGTLVAEATSKMIPLKKYP